LLLHLLILLKIWKQIVERVGFSYPCERSSGCWNVKQAAQRISRPSDDDVVPFFRAFLEYSAESKVSKRLKRGAAVAEPQ